MRTVECTDFLSETLDIARGTVAATIVKLQAARLFPVGARGRHSGTDLSEMDCVNALLALVLDVPRGGDVAPMVQSVRELTYDEPPVSLPRDFTDGLTCFSTARAGTALEKVIADYRAGAFDRWAAGEVFDFDVGIFTNGLSVFLCAGKPRRYDDPLDVRRMIAGYGKLPPRAQRPNVERQITIRGEWFRQIAMKLGPKPPS